MSKSSKLKNIFSFFGKAHFVAMVLLGVALGGMYFVVQRVEPMFDRGRLLPKERFDITTLQIAPAAAVCPGLTGESLRSELEACQKKIAQSPDAAFREMTVPTLDEILKTQPPRFVDLLKRQGLEDMAAVISRHELYVVEFRVPRRYFSKPQILDVRNVLAFHMILKGAICVEGECSRFRSRWEPYAQGFDLVLPEGDSAAMDQSGDVSVWYFIQDGPFTVGIAMEKGIFVAKNVDLKPVHKFEGIARYGKPIFFAATFGSLILAVIFFCLIQGYVDYAMLGCFAFSLAFYVITENSGLFADFAGVEFQRLRISSGINILASAFAFSLAIVRVRPWRVLSAYFGGALCSFLLPRYGLPSDHGVLIDSWPHYTWVLGMGLVTLPTATLSSGIAHCLWLVREAKNKGKGRSHVMDMLRRAFFELAPLMVVMGLFGLEAFTLAEQRSSGTLPARFAPNSLILLFAALGIMSVNSMIRQMLVGRNAASTSEADLLQQRLPSARLAEWQAQKREGIFIDIDIAGITTATEKMGAHTHDLMTALGEAVARMTHAIGYHWICDKTVGDQWLVALSRKNADLSGDLVEVARTFQSFAADLEELTNFFAEAFGVALALHINVIAIRDYNLGPGLSKPYDESNLRKAIDKHFGMAESLRPFHKKPDFVGEELNYILKYIRKAPPGWIGVAGFTEAVSRIGNATALEEHGQSIKGIERLRQLGLSYVSLKYNVGEGSSDSAA